MTYNFIPVNLDRIVQTHTYTAIVLKSNDKRFAIFCEASVGRFLQMHLGALERVRPQSPDLLSMVLNSCDITLKQVLINDLQDTTFYARLFLETQIPFPHGGKKPELHEKHLLLPHIIELDARPSDCIIQAFLHNAPIFCTKEVVSKAVPFVE